MIGTQRQPELLGQTVVVIGGTSGIGLETARRARIEGASVILTGRTAARRKQAARELQTELTAAFDANDSASLQSFFEDLSGPIDHVMVTAGAPHYGPALAMPAETARRNLTDHLLLAIEVARAAADKVRPPGSLVFMGGTGARRPRAGLAIASTVTVAFPTLIASLALELAPIRVNLIAAGLVDTANPPRRRTGGRRRAGGSHHEQHGTYWRNVRHRRRPATDLIIMRSSLRSSI